MRLHLFGCIVLAATAVAFARETDPTQAATPQSAVKRLILNGCVPGRDRRADWFTPSDFAHERGTTSPFGGADGQPHMGLRIKIVGGFRPSTNIAAQAGALDPTQAAMADAGGIAGPETAPLVEVRVRSARPPTSFCPEP
jgi:hypothetical protein